MGLTEVQWNGPVTINTGTAGTLRFTLSSILRLGFNIYIFNFYLVHSFIHSFIHSISIVIVFQKKQKQKLSKAFASYLRTTKLVLCKKQRDNKRVECKKNAIRENVITSSPTHYVYLPLFIFLRRCNFKIQVFFTV